MFQDPHLPPGCSIREIDERFGDPEPERLDHRDRQWHLIVGTGPTPAGFEHCYRAKDLNELMRFQGVKGDIHIHLHGSWWLIVMPDVLRKMLLNMNSNPNKPTVTVSS